jgi:hypothetical protein
MTQACYFYISCRMVKLAPDRCVEGSIQGFSSKSEGLDATSKYARLSTCTVKGCLYNRQDWLLAPDASRLLHFGRVLPTSNLGFSFRVPRNTTKVHQKDVATFATVPIRHGLLCCSKMPGVKRKHLASGEDDHGKLKVARNGHAGATGPPCLGETSLVLLNLPAEILLEIFYWTRGPCMIHVCKQLYELLPGYVGHSKMLLGLAFATRHGSYLTPWITRYADVARYKDRPLAGSNPFAKLYPQLWPLPGPKGGPIWAFHERRELQHAVAGSKWLRPSHLRALHRFLFEKFVSLHLLDNPDYRITTRQIQRLKDLVLGHGGPNADLKLRMQVEINHGGWYHAALTLRDNFLHVRIHNQERTQILYDLFAFSYVPHCFLRDATAVDSADLRDLIVRCCTVTPGDALHKLTRDPDTDHVTRLLKCDEHLLERRILQTLELPPPRLRTTLHRIEIAQNLHELLMLNYVCRDPVTISCNMLSACVEHNMPECLDHLLGNYLTTASSYWADRDIQRRKAKRRTAVTEKDVVRLKNRAAILDKKNTEGTCLDRLEAELEHYQEMKQLARDSGVDTWQEAEDALRDQEREVRAHMERFHDDDDDESLGEGEWDSEDSSDEDSNPGLFDPEEWGPEHFLDYSEESDSDTDDVGFENGEDPGRSSPSEAEQESGPDLS